MVFINNVIPFHECVIIATVVLMSQVLLCTSQQCNLLEIHNCPHSDRLQRGEFWGFIPYSSLDDKCRMLRNALNCALKKVYVADCDRPKVAIFFSQNDVVSAVCDKYRYAYMKGQACFSKYEVKDEVTRCKTRVRAKCESIEEGRFCTRDALSLQPECTTEDVNLMATLIDAHLKPLSDALDCDWLNIETGDIAMPTEKPAPTTVANSTEPQTESTVASNLNRSTSGYLETRTEEHFGRSRNGVKVLEATRIVVGLLCLIGFNVLL